MKISGIVVHDEDLVRDNLWFSWGLVSVAVLLFQSLDCVVLVHGWPHQKYLDDTFYDNPRGWFPIWPWV